MKRILLLLGAVLFISGTAFGQIISQYTETDSGTSPKGIEIWNNTGSSLDFSTNNLVIEKGSNGGTPSADFTLSTGTLADGAVLVIGTSNMETTATGNGAAFHEESFTFNGDDALVVKYGGTITDMFGISGSDPGSSWSGSGVSTANQNIQLKDGISSGDTDGWTDPSDRFETVSTSPSSDQTGFGLAPTGAGGSATKLVVTAINSSSSPSVGTTFDITVQAQDASDIPANVDGAVTVNLSVATGTGSIASGTVSGIIADETNSINITGVIYNTAESGVSITATDNAATLTAGTSSTFTVLTAADTLVLVSAPTSGSTDVTLDEFTVEARRTSDDSKDLNYTKSITISKASGTGTLGGTTSASASAGVATFDDLNFDTAGDFTIQAADGSLTSAASATVTISDPTPSSLIISGVYDGQVNSRPKGVELFVTADIADLSSYGIGAANNGGGTDGQEFTFPADAASAGDFIYVAASATDFNTFFGFDADYTDGDLGINGDDAIELFKDGTVRDVFGDIDTDGSGEDWDYVDGWAYRKIAETATTTFNSSDWIFSGTGELDNAVNASSSTPFPTGTYTNGEFVHITGSEGWRILSTPTSDNTYDDLLGDIWTQGIGTGADVTNGTANVQLFNTTTDNFAAVTDLTATMTAGTGFITYVYSDDDHTNSGTDAGFPKTLSVDGTENSGSVSPTLNGGTSGDDSFSLVGNPYASTIDWDLLTTTDLTGTVYVYDHSYGSVSAPDVSEAVGGGYRVWTGSTGSLTDGLITPFQGFWVQNSGGSAALTIEEADKTTGGTFYKEVKAVNFAFKSEFGNMYDETFFSFDDNAELGKDNHDALQLSPLDYRSYMSLASRSTDDLFDVNNLPTEFDEIQVPVSVKAYEKVENGYGEMEGSAKLTWSDIDRLPESWTLSLSDTETGTTINLREVSEYSFELVGTKSKARVASVLTPLQPTKEKATGNSDRFVLTISQTTSVNNEPGSEVRSFALDQNYPNPFNPTTTINYSVENSGAVTLSVYNLMGQKVAELVNETKSAGSYNVSWNASQAASGMYYYRLEAGGQTITRKMTLIK